MVTIQFGFAPGNIQTIVTDRALAMDRDALDALFAPDDVEPAVTLFGTLPARRLRVLLSFLHEDGRVHTEEAEVLVVPGPPEECRLGADILAGWTLVLDGPSRGVFVEPGM